MDEIITHTINVTLPSLTNLTDLQKEFDALELPPGAREALLRSIVTEQTLSPVMDSPEAICDPPEAVCDRPEAVCDPPVCDPPEAVCDPPEIKPVELVTTVVEPTVVVVEPAAPIVIPESLPSSVESVPQIEPSSRTSVGCCCQ